MSLGKDLSGKNFLITGGTGLIGSAIVDCLMNNNCNVINLDLKKSERASDNFIIDITDKKSLKSDVLKIFEKYPIIHGLVNNAYPRTMDWGTSFWEVKEESFDQNLSKQITSHFSLIRLLAKEMINKQQSCSIVNIGSMYGEVGADFSLYEGIDMTAVPSYFAIKGGIVNLTRYLAALLAKNQIRVNCISPGGVYDGQHETFVKRYNDRVPMGRMANPEDIAPAVAFLLSDHSSYITGQNLIIDGGWTSI